ncbi:MAG TPA: energy transducer TonB [Allocoleopsis sp.]
MFDIIRNPTVIATFISLGFHGLLGLTTPVLVGSFSSNKDEGKNGVGVVKLSTIEQNRIPGLGPNSDTLSTIPRLTLPSNKPVKALPLLPPIPPLKSLQTPSISPNPNPNLNLNLNPSQPNIISSQNRPVIKIPSNPNIPPINVDQPKTLEPKLEPLPNVTLPDISSINKRKNRGEQPQQLADTKSASKPDIKSSSLEKNQNKNDLISRNSNLKEPSEIGDTTVFNDVKPRGKTPASKNIPPNIKPQKNNNEQQAFNQIPVNPNQDPRLFDDGPSFAQPEENSENKPEKKNGDSDIIKEDNFTNNNSSETQPNPPKKTSKKEKNDFQEAPPKAETNITKDNNNAEVNNTKNPAKNGSDDYKEEQPKPPINITKNGDNLKEIDINNGNTTEPNMSKNGNLPINNNNSSAKKVNTNHRKKTKKINVIVGNTPNNNRQLPTTLNNQGVDPSKFVPDTNNNQTTQPYTVAKGAININSNQIKPDKKSEFPEKLIAQGKVLSNNFAYNRTGTTEVEGYEKYGNWANKYNPNYSHIEKHSFTSSNYPKDACLTKLNGNVAMAVLVDKNGKVQDETAEIMISSGFKILNDQAIKDVKKIKLENETDKSKPYYVEIKYEYPEKSCPKLTINNNKAETQVKQSEEDNTPPPNQKKVSKNRDENTPVNPKSNEEEKIERHHEQNTEHSEQTPERKPE